MSPKIAKATKKRSHQVIENKGPEKAPLEKRSQQVVETKPVTKFHRSQRLS
jgi:hypothetical protein